VFGKALERALELAVSGNAATERHAIGELVLDPLLDESKRWRFTAPELGSAWQRLAEAVPDPARSRCEEMALWCAASPGPDAIA
jgi:hypothetical protein